MLVHSIRFSFIRLFMLALVSLLVANGITALAASPQNTLKSPSDVVREFYKAMREQHFREAFALTNYKPAVESLTAEDMEDLRPTFEDKAKMIPETVEITGEQVNGNAAIVFVRVPIADASAQVTSQPVNLANAGGTWIIVFGSAADQEEVRKAGRRYFLDSMIAEHEADVEDFLKRLVMWELVYSQQHGGALAEFPALIQAGMFSNDVIDPKLSGYNYHIAIAKDGKSYVATAEPVRHGHTGKLSFWSDQTGAVKSADNGGKPFKP